MDLDSVSVHKLAELAIIIIREINVVELANQSVHYIGYGYKPYTMIIIYYFYQQTA